ncbi:TD and POZ domain-containing protein 1-like isoform X1 [Argiope bruennichi]|uniref:TD and POZ domain-containing protein 1-like isoform X1 n=2 Tax=Argiope bruennichi TaxID=94029 RepID=UPI0024957E6A|nr:TD and POZ domain-containing protein 1-like isoform X1 [Argiope bruennichi]
MESERVKKSSTYSLGNFDLADEKRLTVMDTMKYKKDAEELADSILYLEEVCEDKGDVTYMLRWVVRDYSRFMPGIQYHCHYIRIGKCIHSLKVLKHDTKVKDIRDKRLYSILLGLTPASSCANISFVLIGRRNKEIRPQNKVNLGCNPDRKCFFEFAESDLHTDHLELVALCRITVVGKVNVSPGIEKSTILQDFEALYNSGLFSDVILCIGGREFNVHKAVLAARSPVFAAMFRNEMKENSENRIQIEDSNEIAVEELLRYLYAEKTIPLTPYLALDLFELADKYDIQNLKAETVDYLKCNFSVENILDILVAADLHDERALKAEAIEFISNNLWHLLKTAKWKIFRTNLELVDCILAYLS